MGATRAHRRASRVINDIVTAVPEALELVIESIAAGGDGVARRDGMVVFVPRTAPGDRVTAQVTRERRMARGQVQRIEVASPDRAVPACPHYEGERCGGCQLQHLTLDAQREAKRHIVQDTLRRIGRRTIGLPSIRAAGSPWRYRERLSLALRRRADGSWYAGLHSRDDVNTVFELKDCHITDECVVVLWRQVMEAADGLPGAQQLRGTVRSVGDRGVFSLEGGASWDAAETFAGRLAAFDHVWWVPEGGRRRRIGGTAAADSAHGGFTQVNPAVAREMIALVLERVLSYEPKHVLDAYAGAGDLSASLHTRGVRATAIELDEDATAYASARLSSPSRALAARVEDVIARHLPADVVVLNPPRSGVDARVTAALESAAPVPKAIVYISCDPATLARDLARMPSWEIRSVMAFDMFPQTAHVETLVELTRTVPA